MALSTYTPNESQIVHDVDVDFLIRPIEEPVHLVQYDDKIPILAVHLYKNGLTYQLPSTASASIRVKKSDGTFVWNDALGWDAGRSILYFEMVENMLTSAGLIRAVVEIDIDKKVAGSSLIKIVVDTNPVQRGDVESTSEYKHLLVYVEEAYEYWQGAKTEAGKAATSASQAATSATNSANSATASANSAAAALASQNAAKTSETNAKDSELAAKDSETKAKTSEINAKTSETNAKTSELAAKESETKAKASENAAKISETNALDSETAAKDSETKAKASENAAKDSEEAALASQNAAKTSEDNASDSAAAALASQNAAKESEDNAKSSEEAALASQNAAKTSEDNAKASELAAATSETNAATSETNAAASESTASTKASEAATSAQNALTSEANAATSEVNAESWANQSKEWAESIEDSEANAAASAAAALASQNAAKTSEDNAKASEDLVKGYRDDAMTAAANAATSETNAATSETTASTAAITATTKASEAAESASTASTKASEAATSAQNAATSETNAATSETNAAAAETEAEKWADQAKKIAQGLVGTLKPMGTIAFANLPALDDASSGDMYNISDQFTTTADFVEGAGKVVPAGSNVYKTAENQWDILAGAPVSGVKGSAESVYRDGLVDISKENIGLGNVDNTADVDKVVKQATELADINGGDAAPLHVTRSATSSFNYAMVLAGTTDNGQQDIAPVSKANMKAVLGVPATYAGSESAGGVANSAEILEWHQITSGDLNNFITWGRYFCSSDSVAATILHMPTGFDKAFVLETLIPNLGKYRYGIQIIRSIYQTKDNLTEDDRGCWIRDVYSSNNGESFGFHEWVRIPTENAGAAYQAKEPFMKNIASGTDLNTIKTSGYYVVDADSVANSCTNVATTNPGAFILLVMELDTNRSGRHGVQIFIKYNTRDYYGRIWTPDAWSSWSTVYSSSNLPASLKTFYSTSTEDCGAQTKNVIGYSKDTTLSAANVFGKGNGAFFQQWYSNSWVYQLYGDYRTGQLATRGKNNGAWQAWRKQIDSGNVGNYAMAPYAAEIPENSNMNNYKTQGAYVCSTNSRAETVANWPPNGYAGWVFVISGINGALGCFQLYLSYQNTGDFYIRRYYVGDNTWSTWCKIANENNIYQMTAGGLYDKKASNKLNITWNSDPVDSITLSGYLLGWMSTWDSMHPITFAKVKTLLGVPTKYAASTSAGGDATRANLLAPHYTGSGGQQGPNFIPSSGGVAGLMMNAFKGISYSSNIIPSNCYVDCLFLDTYNGSDVPTTTLLGILKKTDRYPQLYIGNGVKNNTNWSNISQGFLVHRVTSSSMNFNSYIETGMYHYSKYINSSASNKPSGSYDYGILMVWQYTTENVFQMFFGYQGNGGTIGAPIVFAGRMRYRQNTQYPWTSWNYFIGDQSWNKSNMLMLDNLGSASLPGLDNGVYQSSDNTGLNPFGIVGPITAVHFGDGYTISLGINGNGEVQIVSHNDSYTYDDVSCKIYTDKSPGTFLADYNSPTDSRKMSIGYSGPGISTGSWACMFNPSVWGQVTAIEINNLKALVSDQNVKNTITNIDNEKAVSFIMALNPVTYKINNGKSNRLHWGLIAQEVKSAMDFCGLTTQDFAGYIEYEEVLSLDKDGKEETEDGKNLLAKYALRYDEFIAPMIKMLQVQQETIQAQKEQIQAQQKQIDKLSEKLDQVTKLVLGL